MSLLVNKYPLTRNLYRLAEHNAGVKSKKTYTGYGIFNTKTLPLSPGNIICPLLDKELL